MSEYTIHMIGNAHIDPVWLWRWTEGLEVVKSTYRQAIEFMKEFPDFIFTAGQAITYKWIEENDPQLFEEIKHFVKAGRWNIVNGWWVQPDCNIPQGESFVRQGLYGKRYFREKFGVDVRVGYNVDSFGHNRGLPQILKKSGLDYYVFMRPGPEEKKLEGRLFWWEGQDGSRVLAVRLAHAYSSPGDKDSLFKKIEELYARRFDDINDDICFYGVGDHGGGPTREEILAIKEFNKPGIRLIFSTPDAFFSSVLKQKTDFPVLKDDLQHHARGCYSVVSWIKKENRRSENLLLTAEKFSSIAYLLELSGYPSERILRSWLKVLFNQFHDILCGTSIPEAYEDCRKDYEEIFKDGNEILNTTLREISSRVNTSGPGQAVIFFNPSSWKRKEVVSVELKDENLKEVSILNPHRRKIPCQVSSLNDSKKRLVFCAEVPALGYSVYRIIPRQKKRKERSYLKISSSSIENDFYFLQINPRSGNILHLYDKINRVSVIAPGREGNEMLVLEDPSDTWGHGVNSYEKVTGKFLIQGKPEIVESGPVKATLRIKSVFLNSTVEQEISLYDGMPRIEFNTKVNWQEKHKMLKVDFPLAIESEETTYEIPYGTIVRMNIGEEEPGQAWIDITGTIVRRGRKIKYGVSLINDCKYGFSVYGNEIRMSILRSPIFAFHDPRVPEPGVDYKYTDQGEHDFRYVLIAHRGDWRKAGIPGVSYEFNNPVISGFEDSHPGVYPGKFSALRIEPSNFICTVFKKHEEGTCMILRLHETNGRGGVAHIHLPWFKVSFKRHFRPYEVKTLRMDLDEKPPRIEECNLTEEAG